MVPENPTGLRTYTRLRSLGGAFRSRLDRNPPSSFSLRPRLLHLRQSRLAVGALGPLFLRPPALCAQSPLGSSFARVRDVLGARLVPRYPGTIAPCLKLNAHSVKKLFTRRQPYARTANKVSAPGAMVGKVGKNLMSLGCMLMLAVPLFFLLVLIIGVMFSGD